MGGSVCSFPSTKELHDYSLNNLRLVDKDGKSAKDFAMRICDSEKKKSLLSKCNKF